MQGQTFYCYNFLFVCLFQIQPNVNAVLKKKKKILSYRYLVNTFGS